MFTDNVLSYGRVEPLPEQRELRAGPLSLVYEAGDLRYIRLGEREILRRVYVAVRDCDWGTVPAQLSTVRVEVARDAFLIRYDARHRRDEIDFVWHGTITGAPDGTITFSMEGEALSAFLRSRIGICVLHPIRECAGRPCRVEHVDGTRAEGRFPDAILPHQPFLDIAGLSHEVTPGVRAEVRFSGDTFEMEDQRNWTDASFKTYSTPLHLPFPVEIAAGTRISQSVTLRLEGMQPPVPAAAARAVPGVRIRSGVHLPLPRIGLVADGGAPLTGREVARLKALRLAHLRIELDARGDDWLPQLRRSAVESGALGVPVELSVVVSGQAEAELSKVRAEVERIGLPVRDWLVFGGGQAATPEELARTARRCLEGAGGRVGGGSRAYFTELNRSRPPAGLLEVASYPINPQVHAFDNASLAENLEAQAETVASARRFLGDVPLLLGPITLRPHYNPDATGSVSPENARELPRDVDLRQMSLFGAGWTLGSIKYLAECGVESLTYYLTTGWRGVLETEAGPVLPEQFRSIPGGVYPLYHIFASVAEFYGGHLLRTDCSDPLAVVGLALWKDGRMRALIANLTPRAQEARLERFAAEAWVRRLDASNVLAAMRSPEEFRRCEGERAPATDDGSVALTLPPFGLVRVDIE